MVSWEPIVPVSGNNYVAFLPDLLMQKWTQFFIYSFIPFYLSSYSFILYYLFIYLFTYSFIQSFTCSFISSSGSLQRRSLSKRWRVYRSGPRLHNVHMRLCNWLYWDELWNGSGCVMVLKIREWEWHWAKTVHTIVYKSSHVKIIIKIRTKH